MIMSERAQFDLARRLRSDNPLRSAKCLHF